ncbi:uncharacterized protein LOC135384778 [Ornithodoros turicata]|uniref:uncharacterized protein LOC135384778 n=1 Tax=Ornithodoros turicata TaxID=34597 RepID=UPI003138644B
MADYRTVLCMPVAKSANSGCTDVTVQEMLCIEIEEHPWLYVKTRSEYKDTLKRANAWQAIARTLKLNGYKNRTLWMPKATPRNTMGPLHRESSGQTFESSDTYRGLRDQEERNEPPTVPPHKPSKRKTASGKTSYLTQALAAATAQMASGSRNARLHIDADDCDTMFLLSLRDSFKTLSNKKKRLAQVQIQKVLFDLEFGEESE